MKFGSLMVLTLTLSLIQSVAHARESFFEADVWRDPERPFLFYGEGEVKQKVEAKETPLSAIDDLSELQRVVKKRLARAVMNPTKENVASYLEVNAFLTEKAGRFAHSWKRTLLTYPEYDWTATHPSVNSASTLISREKADAIEVTLKAMAKSWALVFFADKSRLTELMAPIVKELSTVTGIEVAVVSVDGATLAGFDTVHPDRGYARRVGQRGITIFPALLLINEKDKGFEDGRLIATGVVDRTELGRRIVEVSGVRLSEPQIKTSMTAGAESLSESEPCPACVSLARFRGRKIGETK